MIIQPPMVGCLWLDEAAPGQKAFCPGGTGMIRAQYIDRRPTAAENDNLTCVCIAKFCLKNTIRSKKHLIQITKSALRYSTGHGVPSTWAAPKTLLDRVGGALFCPNLKHPRECLQRWCIFWCHQKHSTSRRDAPSNAGLRIINNIAYRDTPLLWL